MQTFRTAQPSAPGLGQEAAQFFAAGRSQIVSPPPTAGPSSFDLAALRTSLPPTGDVPGRVLTRPEVQTAPLASWATDFLVQSPMAVVHSPMHAHSPQVDVPQEQMRSMFQPGV